MPVSDNNLNFLPTPLPTLQECVALTGPSRSSQSRPIDSSYKLLVVDDEKVSRIRLEHLLKKSNYTVLTATNGREAIEIVRREKIDLVMMDIVMPVLDGIKTVRLIRQLFDPSKLPIIMMTASQERDQVLEAFKVGANDYISKPLDNEILLARLNSQLLIRKIQKELRESEERYDRSGTAEHRRPELDAVNSQRRLQPSNGVAGNALVWSVEDVRNRTEDARPTWKLPLDAVPWSRSSE